jgi:NADPH:quinone reductase-like Zn-dependent oxidoreductase
MGTVVQLGPEVRGEWKFGDRIAGVVHGSNKCDVNEGAFAEYALVRESVQMKAPDNVTDVEAATVGVALSTVGLSLYQQLGLPWPGSVHAECWVMIYAGSSATGSIAIQLAKLSGAKVVTTCSPRNREFVKGLGADEAFDYKDTNCAQNIREYTKDSLHFVMDCFGGTLGSSICAGAMSSKGGRICSIIPGAEYPRPKDVRRTTMLAYKICGEPWDFMGPVPPTEEDYQFGRMFWKLATTLLEQGKVKVHPPSLRRGMEGITAGLQELRDGAVSAQKLVYQI